MKTILKHAANLWKLFPTKSKHRVKAKVRFIEQRKKFPYFRNFTTSAREKAARNEGLNGSKEKLWEMIFSSPLVCQCEPSLDFFSRQISCLTGFAWLINSFYCFSLTLEKRTNEGNLHFYLWPSPAPRERGKVSFRIGGFFIHFLLFHNWAFKSTKRRSV